LNDRRGEERKKEIVVYLKVQNLENNIIKQNEFATRFDYCLLFALMSLS